MRGRKGKRTKGRERGGEEDEEEGDRGRGRETDTQQRTPLNGQSKRSQREGPK